MKLPPRNLVVARFVRSGIRAWVLERFRGFRFLRRTRQDPANESGELALKVVPLVVAEIAFVLSGKVYGFERSEVTSALIPFLQSPTLDVEQRDVLLLALELYRDHSIDYVDACLAAEARLTGHALASFDVDCKAIPNVT